ncbi:uncharacterized protein PSFLO_05695 [Pseudozyma flocculosa]|uniref:Uncharacterized protein n=1 Tax=Pseudozyma flocculosa TaxID=84751 RepID=A0A5C3F6U4_9BASI|nr:uncharacterized protein PSFLO_05695 [Pseudozyma flocculosa]
MACKGAVDKERCWQLTCHDGAVKQKGRRLSMFIMAGAEGGSSRAESVARRLGWQQTHWQLRLAGHYAWLAGWLAAGWLAGTLGGRLAGGWRAGLGGGWLAGWLAWVMAGWVKWLAAGWASGGRLAGRWRQMVVVGGQERRAGGWIWQRARWERGQRARAKPPELMWPYNPDFWPYESPMIDGSSGAEAAAERKQRQSRSSGKVQAAARRLLTAGWLAVLLAAGG